MQNTVKTSFFHLRKISCIWPMLSFSVAERLINCFVYSQTDYCNALLVGVSKSPNPMHSVNVVNLYVSSGHKVSFSLQTCRLDDTLLHLG